MVKQFQSDLARAQKAEYMVRDLLQSLTDEYTFIHVGNDREYYHKGDIKAVDKNGKEIMIEIKDDTRIADTGNVLCEEEVYYNDCGQWEKGNMYSDYEIYAVVNQKEQKIYFLDFSILKENYRKGEMKLLPHADQQSIVYLISLGKLRRLGAIIKTVCY